MKSIISKSLKMILLGTAFMMTSCLEDKGYLNIFDGENKDIPVVSFGQADFTRATRSVAVLENEQLVSVNVNIARATADVTVQVEIDMDVLDAWNASHGASEDYELLPDSTYTIVSNTINIPKGEMDGQFSIKVVSTKIDLNHAYALPLRIASTTQGVIASNLSTTMMAVGVLNDYDGIYEVLVTDPSKDYRSEIWRNGVDPAWPNGYDPTLSGNLNAGLEIELVTRSKYSNFFEPVWKDGSGIAGIDLTYLTVDPVTNDVVVQSQTNPALENTAGEDNYYDPETRIFRLGFDWGADPNTRVTVLTLKWNRPRQ